MAPPIKKHVNWPPMPVLRSMLGEGRDVWIAEVLGCDRQDVVGKRRALDVGPYIPGPDADDGASARAAFVAKWRKRLATPVKAQTDQEPLTPADLEQAIRQYYADEGRRPDTERLARSLGRPAIEVQKAFAELMKARVGARYDAGLMTLSDWTGPGYVLPTNRIEYPKPQPKPATVKRPITEEVQPSMGKYNAINWPPHAQLLFERDEIAKAGGNVTATLCERYKCEPAALHNRISFARKELGLKTRCGPRAKPSEVQARRFICEACKDSGLSNEDGTRFCSCAVGRRLATQDAANNPTTTEPATEPLTTETPTEGVSTPTQVEAPTSPTACDSGKTDEMVDCLRCNGDKTVDCDGTKIPCWECGATGQVTQEKKRQQLSRPQADAVRLSADDVAALTKKEPLSTTVPTAQQVDAIAADLTGHQPTQAEVEEMLKETPVESDGTAPEDSPDWIEREMVRWDTLPEGLRKYSYRTMLGRIATLERVCKDRFATITGLQSEVAALTATLEQAAAGATKLLLVDSDGTTRMVDGGQEAPNAEGDEWAETVKTVEGRRIVRVWHCTAAWTVHGTVLCMLVPQGFVLGALPVMQREVA